MNGGQRFWNGGWSLGVARWEEAGRARHSAGAAAGEGSVVAHLKGLGEAAAGKGAAAAQLKRLGEAAAGEEAAAGKGEAAAQLKRLG